MTSPYLATLLSYLLSAGHAGQAAAGVDVAL
jgi:hypothetical protein